MKIDMDSSDYLYTELNTAGIELQKRWHNIHLKHEIERYVGEIPSCFNKMPRGVLFRNVISPDHEFEQFIELTKRTGLAPLGLEHTNDTFSTRNEDKICLIKMAIFEKRNTHNEAIFHYKKIANMQSNDNKKFSEITLENGEHLTSFHHSLLAKHAPANLEIFDLSSWIERNGCHAYEYYKKILAFFLCHAVLFESFVTNSDEAVFENEVVLPAFQHLEKKFGIKPLVAPLIPSISDKYWWCYPNKILDDLENATRQ